MTQVSAEEAQVHLPDLIAEAVRGETVFIKYGEQTVQLVPVDMPVAVSENRPKFGSAKGLIHMADDFDAPLEEFADYMPGGYCLTLKLSCGLLRAIHDSAT